MLGWGVLTAVIWKDKRDVCILTNVHYPKAKGNVCDEHGRRAHKHAIVDDYNDKEDRTANSSSINWKTWKCTNKLFFHLLNLRALNSYHANILRQRHKPPKILSGFNSKLIWNECKGTSTSIQPKSIKSVILKLNTPDMACLHGMLAEAIWVQGKRQKLLQNFHVQLACLQTCVFIFFIQG